MQELHDDNLTLIIEKLNQYDLTNLILVLEK